MQQPPDTTVIDTKAAAAAGAQRVQASRAMLPVLVTTFLAAIWLATRHLVPDGPERTAFATLMTMLPPLVAMTYSLLASRHRALTRRERRGWVLVGVGSGASAAFAAGSLMAASLETTSPTVVASVALVHYLALGLMVAGLGHWVRDISPAATMGTLMDLACVGLFGYVVLWSTELRTAMDGTSLLTHPFALELLLLAAVVTVLAQIGRHRIRGPEVLTTLGMAAIVASDLRIAFIGTIGGDMQRTFLDAATAANGLGLSDLGWSLGYLGIALAGTRRRDLEPDAGQQVPLLERSSTWETVWALVPFVALSAAIVTWDMGDQDGSHGAFLMLITLLLARCSLVAVHAVRTGRGAQVDPLTGAWSHRQFQERLPHLADRALTADKPLSLIMMDVDDFELVNDVYGHGEGDRFLREMSWVIRNTLSDGQLLFRQGGDEFAIVLPGVDAEHATALAEELRAEVARLSVSAGPPPLLTMGVASLPEHTRDVHELAQLASGTLYWAKLNGKATVTRYDPEVVKVMSVEDRVQVLEQSARLRAVLALARALDARDAYTARHSQNVSRYSVAIAQQLGWTPEQSELLRIAGLLHDVGKIGVRDSVLRKPENLTEAEWEEMRQHPTLSARVIAGIAPDEIVPWVVAHHERFDGRGYPRGLVGEEIPLGARIIAVADTFDAMTSSRAYRPGLPVNWAVHELVASVGAQFDPNVVRAFLHAARSGTLGIEADDEGRLHAPTEPSLDPEFAPIDEQLIIGADGQPEAPQVPGDERPAA